MRVYVITLFPQMFASFAETSMVGRGLETGAAKLELRDLREFGHGKHRAVDDTPYGGGSGMVMRVEPLVQCMEAIDAEVAATESGRPHRVLLTPQGRTFDQDKAIELSRRSCMTFVCGRYEGFDERVREFVDEELSLGDFVMTGGEVAAMAIIDACVRLLPGVLGNAQSAESESHSAALDGLLEYPQYTRPVEFRGRTVPEVLRGGNHAAIEAWRKTESRARTERRRPDLVHRERVAGEDEP